MKHLNKKEELTSLNSVLSEFSLEQLEERLETDPLAVGGLLEISSSTDMSVSATSSGCEFTCGCYGKY